MLLGCLNANLMNDEQIVNLFILNATWIVWKRRCCIKFENYWINNQQKKQWLVAALKFQKQILCSRNKKIQTISTIWYCKILNMSMFVYNLVFVYVCVHNLGTVW